MPQQSFEIKPITKAACIGIITPEQLDALDADRIAATRFYGIGIPKDGYYPVSRHFLRLQAVRGNLFIAIDLE